MQVNLANTSDFPFGGVVKQRGYLMIVCWYITPCIIFFLKSCILTLSSVCYTYFQENEGQRNNYSLQTRSLSSWYLSQVHYFIIEISMIQSLIFPWVPYISYWQLVHLRALYTMYKQSAENLLCNKTKCEMNWCLTAGSRFYWLPTNMLWYGSSLY